MQKNQCVCNSIVGRWKFSIFCRSTSRSLIDPITHTFLCSFRVGDLVGIRESAQQSPSSSRTMHTRGGFKIQTPNAAHCCIHTMWIYVKKEAKAGFCDLGEIFTICTDAKILHIIFHFIFCQFLLPIFLRPNGKAYFTEIWSIYDNNSFDKCYVTVRTFLYAIFFLLLCRCKTKLHIEAIIDKNMDNGE